MIVKDLYSENTTPTGCGAGLMIHGRWGERKDDVPGNLILVPSYISVHINHKT